MAKIIPLTSLDKMMFRLDKPETPFHTASLSTYQIPRDCGPDYTRKLFGTVYRQLVTAAPFNYVLRRTGRKMSWEVLDPTEIDNDYHVRRSALPSPGGERELGTLVSRLHSIHLDRSRPLWEFYLIENLQGNRFATYMKMHHALADGGAVIKILSDTFTRAPTDDCRAPWARDAVAQPEAAASAGQIDKSQSATELFTVLRQMVKSLVERPQQGLVGPFSAPPSALNVAVSAPRRYATMQVKLERMRAVGKAAGATVNDVFLAMVSGALRRYLDELGKLPSRNLIGLVPVAIARGGEELGNAVSGLYATLATTTSDPKERLRLINDSVTQNKKVLAQLTPAQLGLLSTLGSIPMILAKPRAPRRPMHNIVISNVPGPREKLWFERSEVEALYPCSVVLQQYAMNITARGYHDTINIGFLAARDALPRFQHIAVYTADALDELEQCFNIVPAEEKELRRA